MPDYSDENIGKRQQNEQVFCNLHLFAQNNIEL